MYRALTFLALVAVLAVAPAAAHATGVISPADGATVGSRPQFVFDVAADSWATVEVSDSPDVKTAGGNAGTFVDAAQTSYLMKIAGGVGTWNSSPLDAGLYYWHASVEDGAWSPVWTMTVQDEPAILEGYTARARRLHRPVRKCRTPVQVSGKIAYDDNDRDPRLRYSITYSAGGGVVGSVRGTITYTSTYSGIICAPDRQLNLSITLRDRGGHLTRGDERTVRVS